jgi:hypothetical protein
MSQRFMFLIDGVSNNIWQQYLATNTDLAKSRCTIPAG